MVVAPYGSWSSPVALDLVAAGFVRLAEARWDGEAITWLEGRAEDGGRQTLVRWTRAGSSAADPSSGTATSVLTASRPSTEWSSRTQTSRLRAASRHGSA